MKNFIAAALFSLALAACGDGLNPAPNGEACEDNTDCASDDCRDGLTGCHPLFGCSTFEFTGGMCTEVCEWDTDATDPLVQAQGTCADQEWCLVYGSSDAVCFQSCAENGCVREDYECVDLGNDIHTCLPPEDTNAREARSSSSILEAPVHSVIK